MLYSNNKTQTIMQKLVSPNYRSFCKVVEFFQTRYISSWLHPCKDGFQLDFTYQCNDGKRTVYFFSYDALVLRYYNNILKGETADFVFLSVFNKLRLYNSLFVFPHHAEQVVVLGTGVNK